MVHVHTHMATHALHIYTHAYTYTCTTLLKTEITKFTVDKTFLKVFNTLPWLPVLQANHAPFVPSSSFQG